jgi:hypothetical protein
MDIYVEFEVLAAVTVISLWPVMPSALAGPSIKLHWVYSVYGIVDYDTAWKIVTGQILRLFFFFAGWILCWSASAV